MDCKVTEVIVGITKNHCLVAKACFGYTCIAGYRMSR